MPDALGAADERVDLLGADDGDRDDRHVERERQAREAGAEGAQPVAVAERLRDARDALGEEQDQLARAEQRERVLARCATTPPTLPVERVDRRRAFSTKRS